MFCLTGFNPEKLVRDHLGRVAKTLAHDQAGDWARQTVQQIEQDALDNIGSIASNKMLESLTDGERHSAALMRDDLCITISTFPCSVAEVRRIHYPKGYLTYLDRMVGITWQENPHAHWAHFQFGRGMLSYWVQFTLFPNRTVLSFTPLYHMPVDLLSAEEKKKTGLE